MRCKDILKLASICAATLSLVLTMKGIAQEEREADHLDMVADSIMVAKEVRNRYTLLQLLWDLGLLEEMAQKTADYFEAAYRG